MFQGNANYDNGGRGIISRSDQLILHNTPTVTYPLEYISCVCVYVCAACCLIKKK